MSAPIDHIQRLEALDPLYSICVTAPAGSGKTELLSQRVLTLLARAEQPEEILAITFTRKAAAEMHHRIMAALQFAHQFGEPEESHKRLTWQLATAALQQDSRKNWQLLANPSRLKVQTIDSLCGNLTRQMPILSDFGAQPKIVDNAMPHYKRAVEQLLAQLEADSPVADSLEVLLRQLDNDWSKVERLLVSLLQRRDQWLFHIYIGHQHEDPRSVLESTLDKIISDCLADLRHELMLLSGELLPLLDYAGTHLKAQHAESAAVELAGIKEWPSVTVTSLPMWRAITDVLLTGTGTYRKKLDKNAGFPTMTLEGNKQIAKEKKEQLLEVIELLKSNEKLLPILNDLRKLPSANYSDSQWVFLQSLTLLLPVLVAQLRVEFQQAGEVDYSQMSIAALQALGDGMTPTELRLKLDYQLKHILIDEFQDTATTQFELLKRLTEGWYEYNSSNSNNPNTLFLVGDGMQSIYGFREANVGLFLEARKNGVNQLKLKDLPLQVNFRSHPEIVNWVNHSFEHAFPSCDNLSRGAVKYSASTAYKPSLSHAGVHINAFIGDDARHREAESIAEKILDVTNKDPEASIAILVRNRSHLNHILPVLSERGIDWQATDIDPLSTNAAVMDLLVLTKALLNIADRISWAALLRTPILGLSNSDLFVLLGEERRIYSVLSSLRSTEVRSRLSRHAQERVAAVVSILDQALSKRQRLSLRSWVEGVWLALGGAACVQSLSQFKAVDDYLDLLERYQEPGGYIAMNLFQEAVTKLYAAPEVNDSNLQVMTIHKSKGLEFDTVIIPSLERRPRANDKALLMWSEYLSDDTSSGLVMSPLAAPGSDDAIYDYLRYEASASDNLENTRLLYVAVTRAVKSLCLSFTQAGVYDEEDIKAPSKQSLLGAIWGSIGDQIEWHSHRQQADDQLSMFFEGPDDEVKSQRLSAEWRQPSWSFSNPLSSFYIQGPVSSGEFNIPDFVVDQYPRQLGNVVHAILEHCVLQGLESWQRLIGDDKERWLDRLLQVEGVGEKQWADARHSIKGMIDNCLADEKGRWLLSSAHQRSEVEFELLACLNSGVERKIIDRCFIDENNTRWIVDYKTASPRVDENLSDFIEREVEQYKNQLMSYKYYMGLLNNDLESKQEIKTALYFPAIPHWEEVSI